jgi:hypothetical protein
MMIRRLPALLVLCVPALAAATPHDIPFSYGYATLGKGQLEIEQYADLTPVKGQLGDATPTTLRSILTTEIEYGLSDKLELGLYFQFTNDPSSSGLASNWPLGFDGIKQRLRYRLAEAGQWPVDTSLYLELSELSTEVELEAKVNLERRLGPIRLLMNLWAENEFYYNGVNEWVLHPTAGASFELTPALKLGFEYWLNAEFGADTGFNPAPHHYLGPTMSFQGSRFWCTFAPYLRLDRWDRSGQVGDEFGRLWLRLVIGVEP